MLTSIAINSLLKSFNRHKVEIEEICHAASREMELEVKMRITEEEWTEQVLAFEHYKRLGPIYLDKAFTERLLEQLEDAQALLARLVLASTSAWATTTLFY